MSSQDVSSLEHRDYPDVINSSMNSTFTKPSSKYQYYRKYAAKTVFPTHNKAQIQPNRTHTHGKTRRHLQVDFLKTLQ